MSKKNKIMQDDVYKAVTQSKQTEGEIRRKVALRKGRREFDISPGCVRDYLTSLISEGRVESQRRESDLVVEYWRT